MNRRGFLAGFVIAASGLVVPEPVRRYFFAPSGGWAAIGTRVTNLATPLDSSDAVAAAYLNQRPFGHVFAPGHEFPQAATTGDFFLHLGREWPYIFSAGHWIPFLESRLESRGPLNFQQGSQDERPTKRM